MYKIYINDNLLTLKSTSEITMGDINCDSLLLIKYKGRVTQIDQIIEKCERKDRKHPIILHSTNLQKMFEDLCTCCSLIEASGGIVRNEKGELLFIFRRGFWDLPKGKLEKNETKRESAIREVIEETGIKSAKITDKIGTTYHIFTSKGGKRILKKSYWYAMTTTKQKLTAQKEEDIEDAKWLTYDQFLLKSPIYSNILHILKKYQKSLKL